MSGDSSQKMQNSACINKVTNPCVLASDSAASHNGSDQSTLRNYTKSASETLDGTQDDLETTLIQKKKKEEVYQPYVAGEPRFSKS